MLGRFKPDSAAPSPFLHPPAERESVASFLTKLFTLLVAIFAALMLLRPEGTSVVGGRRERRVEEWRERKGKTGHRPGPNFQRSRGGTGVSSPMVLISPRPCIYCSHHLESDISCLCVCMCMCGGFRERAAEAGGGGGGRDAGHLPPHGLQHGQEGYVSTINMVYIHSHTRINQSMSQRVIMVTESENLWHSFSIVRNENSDPHFLPPNHHQLCCIPSSSSVGFMLL